MIHPRTTRTLHAFKRRPLCECGHCPACRLILSEAPKPRHGCCGQGKNCTCKEWEAKYAAGYEDPGYYGLRTHWESAFPQPVDF